MCICVAMYMLPNCRRARLPKAQRAYEEGSSFVKHYLNNIWPPFSFSLCDNSVDIVSCVRKEILFVLCETTKTRTVHSITLCVAEIARSREIVRGLM